MQLKVGPFLGHVKKRWTFLGSTVGYPVFVYFCGFNQLDFAEQWIY
jgi:hypothetical protein